jgi:hypothetical protein
MSQRMLIAVRIDSDVLKVLHEIKEQDGVPVNEQIRRGIHLWLEHKKRPMPLYAPRPEKKPKK